MGGRRHAGTHEVALADQLLPQRLFGIADFQQIAMLRLGPRGRDFYANPDGEFLHLTDWIDAKEIHRDAGRFGLDDYGQALDTLANNSDAHKVVIVL